MSKWSLARKLDLFEQIALTLLFCFFVRSNLAERFLTTPIVVSCFLAGVGGNSHCLPVGA